MACRSSFVFFFFDLVHRYQITAFLCALKMIILIPKTTIIHWTSTTIRCFGKQRGIAVRMSTEPSQTSTVQSTQLLHGIKGRGLDCRGIEQRRDAAPQMREPNEIS
jgi:hypothetical protein